VDPEPQNIYDDPDFFEGYRDLREADKGFNAMEQQAVRALLPDLRGLSVLDLGCGFGTFAIWACDQGAQHVTGVDVSQKMLDAAAQSPCVSYRHASIEDVTFAPGSIDCVVSSLALHYVADYPSVVARVAQWLKPGGYFVFSVEHPIATAHMQMPGWIQDDEGNNLHFPVNNYAEEGPRTQEWFVAGVRKYHRTMATYLNTLVDAGLVIEGVSEPVPSPEAIQERPELAQELGRPPFLVVSSRRPPR